MSNHERAANLARVIRIADTPIPNLTALIEANMDAVANETWGEAWNIATNFADVMDEREKNGLVAEGTALVGYEIAARIRAKIAHANAEAE